MTIVIAVPLPYMPDNNSSELTTVWEVKQEEMLTKLRAEYPSSHGSAAEQRSGAHPGRPAAC
ncbi:hypothetical protein [Nocardia fluminea]|uniref:hypothetical protein n=1 Tax=Nocardia fluminea TaxID=134984 RepID=UPI0033F6E2FF